MVTAAQAYWLNRKRRRARSERYEAEASALFARFTTPPSAARKALINTLIKSLKTAGVWSKLDAFYVLAAADEQAAQRNWIADQYNLSPTNAPTFAADKGYTGDGATSYLDTGFNPTTAASPKFVLNSGHMGLWSNTDLPNGANPSREIGNSSSRMERNGSTARRVDGAVNSGTVKIVDQGLPGHVCWSRSGPALWEGYGNGIDNGGGTGASTSLTNSNFRLLAANGVGFGTNQIAAGHFGSDLSAVEVLAVSSALMTYMDAVGALGYPFMAYGDSTASASGATGSSTWFAVLAAAYDPDRTAASGGVSGESSAQMVARVQADTTHQVWSTIFMDRPNTGETSTDWLTNMKAAAALIPHDRWLVVPPVLNSPSGQPDASGAAISEIQAALLSDPFFAGHTFDAGELAAYIAEVNDDATRVGTGDWTHFNTSGQALQAARIKTTLDALGW